MLTALQATERELRIYPSILARDRGIAQAGRTQMLTMALTFAELFEQLTPVDEHAPRRRLSDIQEWLMVRELFSASTLPHHMRTHFSHLVQEPMGVLAILRAIHELRRGGLTAGHFQQAREALGPKLLGMAEVLQQYETALLAIEAIDEAERQRLAVFAVLQGQVPWQFLHVQHIVVLNGGDALDAGSLDLLQAFVRRGVNVEVHVPWRADRGSAYAWPEATVHAIESREACAIELHTLSEECVPSSYFQRLHRAMANPDPDHVVPTVDKRLNIVVSGAVAEEARKVAGQVCGFLRDGFAAEEICIVLPDPVSLGPALVSELNAQGVATYLSAHCSLKNTRCGAAFLLAFEAGTYGYPRESLVRLWRVFDPGFEFPGQGVVSVEQIAFRLRRAGAHSRAVGGYHAALCRYEAGRYRKNSKDAAWAEHIGQAIEQFVDVLESVPIRGAMQEMLHEPARLFARFTSGGTTYAPATDGLVAQSLAQEHQALRVLAELMQELSLAADTLSHHAAQSTMTRQELTDLLALLMTQRRLSSSTFRAGRVQLLQPEALVGTRFDVVIWAGLNVDTFPRPRLSDIVLSDDQRAEINRAFGPRVMQSAPTTGRGALPQDSRDMWLWLESLAAVKERLVLNCRIQEGRDDMGHSPVVRELAHRSGIDLEALEETPSYAQNILHSRRHALLHTAFAVLPRLSLGGTNTPGLRAAWVDSRVQQTAYDYAQAWLQDSSAQGERWRLIEWRASGAGMHGRLPPADQKFLSAYFASTVHSTSKLDTLGSCSYRHFASAICGLDRSDVPTLEADARERGSAAHAALHVVYADIIAQGGLRVARQDPAAALARAERIFWQAAPNVITELKVHPYLQAATLHAAWLAARAQLQADLERKDHAEAREPVALEYRFDDRSGGDAQALVIEDELGERQVTVRGSIDRIDMSPDDIYTLDYKSTLRKRTPHRHFQLPIYALVAAERFGKDKRLQSEWVALRTLKRAAAAETPQDYASFLAEVREDLWKRIDRTVSGDISPDPDPVSMCAYCDFRPLCRLDPELVEMEDAKEASP